jgi:hypothetical protein
MQIVHGYKVSPEDKVSELIKLFIPTSRALQINKTNGLAMTNTNYWMVNTIENCLHYSKAIHDEIESEQNFMTRDRGADLEFWNEVIVLLEDRKSMHIIEDHDPRVKPPM